MFFYTFGVQTIDLMCQLRTSIPALILTNVAAYGPPLGHKSLRCLRRGGGSVERGVAAAQISLGPPITITTRYLARAERQWLPGLRCLDVLLRWQFSTFS